LISLSLSSARSPHGARICNVAVAQEHSTFVLNALAPIGGCGGIPSTPNRAAPIFMHSGERVVSVLDPGCLGIPVLKHIHHVHPHYIYRGPSEHTHPPELYLLVHGWRDGKFAVLKHEPALSRAEGER
jgi:hypothetical protein